VTEHRRAFVVVMDAVGAGALPDAPAYGDPADADTLGHLAQAVGGLDLPTLGRLGLGNIRLLEGVPPVAAPAALHGRLRPLGPGKESVTGHWELMGVVPPVPLPTFPGGFPPDVVRELEGVSGRRFCCNQPYNGQRAMVDFGQHHARTGELILYTSVDSVLQLAAHVDVVGEAELQDLCRRIREQVMVGPRAVGRVIARPFAGPPGRYERTEGRRDFSVLPPTRSYLEELSGRGIPVHAVGKTHDLFAGVGFTARHPGASNAAALAETTRLIRGELERGLVFTNLIETDQRYGHRKDVHGFHRALQGIDEAVAGWLDLLRPGDLLVLTADHGVDPAAPHTDHTREHAPLLAVFEGHAGRAHDGPLADVGATCLAWLAGDGAAADGLPGASFG
jgi:phosphopentomutase